MSRTSRIVLAALAVALVAVLPAGERTGSARPDEPSLGNDG
ncbi:MAG TPA: hypothetical protein VD695_06355 [Gaiellaceae bacterium]|nr:hypothetical protein [Gaiellaceae bacterium]